MRRGKAVLELMSGMAAIIFASQASASAPHQSDSPASVVSRTAAPATPLNTAGSVPPKHAAALRSMVSDMAIAWRARDAHAYAAQFAQDAEHINAYGMWWRGRGEIEQSIKVALERIYPDNPISADEVTVRMAAPELAIVQYRWQLQPYSDPDGTKYEKPQGRVTQVVALRQEGWKIINFQSTFINSKVPQPR